MSEFESPTRTAWARLQAVVEAGEFEGVPFKLLRRPIQVGDTYLAARNTGPHLLTAREIVREEGFTGGYVCPVENAYAFDIPECIPIEFQIEEQE